MKMYCPDYKGGGACDLVVCLFRCKERTKARCAEYAKQWEQVQAYEVPQKYLDKYGKPTLVVPIAFRKRGKRKEVK